MLRPGGGVGECICAYALASPQNIGFAVTWGIETRVIVNSTPVGILTGTLLNVEWRVKEYVAGVLVSDVSGVLNAGDPPHAEIFASIEATYTLQASLRFDDGSWITYVYPLEVRTGGATHTIGWKELDLTRHDCSDMDISIDSFVASGTRTTDPVWFSPDITVLDTGTTFSGEIPQQGVVSGLPMNLLFDGGADISEWSDLPPSMVSVEACGIGFLMQDCVI